LSSGRRGGIGFWEAFAIGVGGMVGGGIFAVLGLTIMLARGAAPLAFLVAGLIALITAYSYAKLSVRYPSEGGTIEYVVRAYGNGFVAGWLNTLLLLSYVVMLALYSYAFGSYGSGMAVGREEEWIKDLLVVVVIGFFTLVNMLGAYVTGKTEDLMVGFKIAILLLFTALGILTMNSSRLSPTTWPSLTGILSGGLLIFLAYEGFELIANTAYDTSDPKRVLPKALYASVLFVIAIYIAVAAVAVGNLTLSEVERARDYALAEAAKPFLGEAGFMLIGLAALLSTASAINATLYGSARVSYMVARYGELPRAMARRVWKGAYEGLIILAVLAATTAIGVNLEGISLAGSLGFLVIFASVNLANARLHVETDSNRYVSMLGAAACIASIAVLSYHAAEENPRQLEAALAIILGAAVFEAAYRAVTGRRISPYIDWRLRERARLIETWDKWIPRLVEAIRHEIRDAEVYLVGSVARGEYHKAHDLDVLVVTKSPPSREEEAEVSGRIAGKAGLPGHHPVHLHFAEPRLREHWLKHSRKYKKLT